MIESWLLILAAGNPLAIPPTSQMYERIMPPPEYRGDVSASTTFLDFKKLQYVCGKAPSGKQRLGCAVGKSMYVLDPCPFADKEWYALILCHEKAHINGWKHEEDLPAEHD